MTWERNGRPTTYLLDAANAGRLQPRVGGRDAEADQQPAAQDRVQVVAANPEAVLLDLVQAEAPPAPACAAAPAPPLVDMRSGAKAVETLVETCVRYGLDKQDLAFALCCPLRRWQA